MISKAALEILADGEFHSGEEIGQALGVSRAAVWKQLSTADGLGLDLESRHGKGYRIPGGLDLLSEAAIRQGLDAETDALLDRIDLRLSTDSTNRQAMLHATENPGSRIVCLAESQLDGRGRHGRRWLSPFANSIYLSIAWEFAGGASALEGLSLAVGVAAARSLRACDINDIGLKWPNDIVSGGRKLGGILIEMSGDLAGPCTVVIGIGINGAVADTVGEQIDIPWTDMRSLGDGKLPNRNALVAKLLNELVGLLSAYERGGFANWRAEWSRLDALDGRDVEVYIGQECISGRAMGVDEQGGLRLQTASGIEVFQGGEVSLKPV